ncbi:MAG: lysophospholipid acyltransferase family protein [Desulfobacula sp.]
MAKKDRMTVYTLYGKTVNNRLISGTVIFLMNAFSIPLMILWTMAGTLMFPLGFVFMRVFLRYPGVLITRKCIWIYGRVWQMILGLFVEFESPKILGEPFKQPGIIVVNHRSFFDTYCMNMMPVSDVCFAVRAWPFKIPLYNIFMRMAGYINIETFSWERILSVSKRNLINQSYILFFPEGHRSLSHGMNRFYSGAFKMAVEHNAPVIPICITGTEELLPPRRLYLKPAKIKMRILDPVYPDQFEGELRHLSLQRYVKAEMARCISQMDAKDCIAKDYRLMQ